MTPAEKLDDYVNARRLDMEQFLAELVRVPSDNPPGDCSPHAERAAELMEALGLSVERHHVPQALARENGMVSCTNLIVRHRFSEGPTIALNAHGDVVPPGEGWTRDPYGAEIVDGWMYGRGVAVSKSDIATYVFALLALIRSGAELKGTIELHITYDEEVGGEIGPAWLIREGLTKPDFSIGAGFSFAVVTAHNGCLHLEVDVIGRSAHAAMPFTGVDALEAATATLTDLYAYRRTLRDRVSAIPGIGAPQVTIGLISGGINTNVVPDRVTLRLDRRLIPEEDAVVVEADLRTLIGDAVSRVEGAGVEIRRVLLAKPLAALPEGQRLTAILCQTASAIMDEPVSAKGVPLYTDARHYAEAGIPTVLYGAGSHTIEEANAHRADERLPLADLHNATRVVARALMEFLSGE